MFACTDSASFTARISIYLHHKLYFDHSKLPDFLFMLSTVYIYSIQELFLLDYARSTFAEYLRKYHKRQSTASSYFMARDTWLNVHNMQMRYHEWSEEGSTGCPLFLLKLFIFIFFFLPPWKFHISTFWTLLVSIFPTNTYSLIGRKHECTKKLWHRSWLGAGLMTNVFLCRDSAVLSSYAAQSTCQRNFAKYQSVWRWL